MATEMVWCLVIDDKNELIGVPFQISVESDSTNIAGLKEKVQEKKSPDFDHVAPDQFVVCQCMKTKLFADEDNRRLKELFSSIDFLSETDIVEFASAKLVKGLQISENEILLVQVPSSLSLQVAQNGNYVTSFDSPLMADANPRPRKRHRGVSVASRTKKSFPVSGLSASKPRRLVFGETARRHQIAFRLYEAVWKHREEAWARISKVVEDQVPENPLSPDEAAEKTRATLVDLTSLLNWTVHDTNWQILTPKFLVRDEYLELDRYLDDEDNQEHVLLVGQPGIGKTTYLTYSLVKRLIAGLPTIYALAPRKRYLFFDAGVYWIPDETFDDSENPLFFDQQRDGALVLFDLNERQPTIPDFQNWRILVSSSPYLDRYQGWVKHENATTFAMRPWSWKEIYFARETASIQRPFESLYSSFVKYGGSARNLFSRRQEQIDRDIRIAIDNCTDIRSLFPSWSGFQDTTSYALVTINPLANEDGVLQRHGLQGQIASRYIFDQLLEAKGDKLVDSMRAAFQMLFRHKATRSTSNTLFEGVGNRHLFNSLAASPICIRSLAESGGQISVNLQHVRNLNCFELPHVRSFKELNPSCYHRALSSTATGIGIDSFALEVDEVGEPIALVLFRFTTTMDCPINPSFLARLWTQDTHAESPIPWKFVFVVPIENEARYCPQKWTSEAAEKLWGRRVSQYVLGVDTDKLWDAVRAPLYQTF